MKFNKKLAGVVGLSVLSGVALATAADTDFAAVVTQLTNWTDGSLGKVLALAIFVVGMAAGVVRQSLMAAVAGIAGAMVLSYGPAIITNVFGATI